MTNKEAVNCLISMQYTRTVGTDDLMAIELAIEALAHFKKGTFEYDEEAGEYVCSECGHYTASEFDMEDEPIVFEGKTGWGLKTPHYCKHCGAYMRGE